MSDTSEHDEIGCSFHHRNADPGLVINIQNLVLSGASAPSDLKADSNKKKWRRLFIESSDKEKDYFCPDLFIDETFFKELIVCSVKFNNNIPFVSLSASVQLFM